MSVKTDKATPIKLNLPNISSAKIKRVSEHSDISTDISCIPIVYSESLTVEAQKNAALEMLNKQHHAMIQCIKIEIQYQRISIDLRATMDIAAVQASLDQSRQQALFSLDQQHAQRQMEILQKAQEQRLKIESTANGLLMQRRERKLNDDMSQRLRDIDANWSSRAQFMITQFDGCDGQVRAPLFNLRSPIN